MTKEELEKEAEEYTNKLLEDWELYDPEALQEAYIASAEPREKRIAELEQKLEQTEKDLADYQFNYPTIKKLEAQIEKMKSCVNCRYCINEKCPWQPKGCKMEHWELRR